MPAFSAARSTSKVTGPTSPGEESDPGHYSDPAQVSEEVRNGPCATYGRGVAPC